jgi:hypothetical protein
MAELDPIKPLDPHVVGVAELRGTPVAQLHARVVDVHAAFDGVNRMRIWS